MKKTITDIQQEQQNIEQEQNIINQRINNLKSMIAKYVEATNDTNNNKPKQK